MDESGKEINVESEVEEQNGELSAEVKQKLILLMLAGENRKIRSNLSKLLLLNSVMAVGIVAVGIVVWRKA